MNCCPTHNKKHIARSIAVKISENEKFAAAYRKSHPIKSAMPMELRTRIWNKFIENSDPIVEKYSDDVEKFLKKQGIAAIKKLPGTFSKAEMKKWVKELAEINKQHIGFGVNAGGNQAIDDARDLVKPKKGYINKLDEIDDFDLATPASIKFINEKALASSLEVNKTSLKRIKNAVATGIAAEESVAEIAKRLPVIFNPARATIIAQTETVGAVNFGTIEGSTQSGVVWGHQWVGSLDNVIRETHEQMTLDEDTAKLGDTFSNGGEYPGGSGIAEEDIGCRCAMFQLTEKP